MIEKTAWDVRKYPEKFAVYRILCNFAVVFQNCINSMEAKYIHRELSAVIEEAYRYFSVITVTGPRQSGKTTLLRCISGILKPCGGSILFEGKSIYGLPSHAVAKRGICLLYTSPSPRDA